MPTFRVKNIIGLMSGTSLDGLDIAFCSFKTTVNNTFSFEIISTKFFPYDKNFQKKIQDLTNVPSLEFVKTEHELTNFWADCLVEFIESQTIKPDLIAMHGQTIFHQPQHGFTKQIGNPALIAARTQTPVVADFRSLDVAYGGQGAPLVPIGDKLLFGNYDYCLNLGGIANISSFEPHQNGNTNQKSIAFDICPFNMVLNFFAQKLGFDFDNGGNLAAEGKENIDLLQKLDDLAFYQSAPPRSLGREWVEENIFVLQNDYKLSAQDWLRTFISHTVNQISKHISEKSGVLLTGGGAHNHFFVEKLREKNPQTTIFVPSQELIDFKEAIIFAFLGWLRFYEQANALASVTGARKDSCGGAIWLY